MPARRLVPTDHTPPGTARALADAWRIALVDDHAIVRIGYRRLLELEPDLEVCAEFADAESAAAALLAPGAAGQVDLLILDLSMPGRSGLDLLRQLHDALPALQVLVVSMHDSAAMQSQCQRAGAAGFVSKAVDPLAVLRAVRAIQAGLRPQSSGPRPPGRRAPHEQLTAREFAVMQLLVTGASVEAIARQLEVSDKTVSNYQTLIRQKLGVNNTVDLLHYAQRHGIVP